jgi:starch synthase (maltosyl-transferring)
LRGVYGFGSVAHRIQIQSPSPLVDCGHYPAKACVGDEVRVEATIFRDGHEVLGAALRMKPQGARRWQEDAMTELGNDRWAASFVPGSCGRWCYRIEAWVDPVASFQWELRRKVEAGQEDLSSELAEGAVLLERDELTVEEALAAGPGPRVELTRSETVNVDVDRTLARFGSWYELFPRSWGGFGGVERLLPQFAELGFDVLYLPPIHPIGHTNRKGRNNTLTARPRDPGSPWAIGSEEGGHTAIHSDLGTMDDFERLVASAREHELEIALDYAIQCSPDHPWLREHPEWFHHRPDGTLKYAENPPKRYQDIYNVNFETEDREGLWNALRDVMLFWVERGVRVFRVDNPHTKPVPFWEWLIGEVRAREPELVLLSEAFTRPAMMTTLAKAGFQQSYTYFTWKNTRWELV